MDPIEFVKEIEENYDVRSITFKNIEVWPFLRHPYYFEYLKKNIDLGDREIIDSMKMKSKKLKNIFYGFDNRFKKFDYLLFSNALENRLIDDKYINKLAYDLIEQLNSNKVLLIEYPGEQGHVDRSRLLFKNVVSSETFTFFYLIKIFNRKIAIKNDYILKEINKRYKININYQKLVTRFFYFEKIFTKYFGKIKPKLIFLSNYYNIYHQAVIYSAKKLGIPTIELQHGIINRKHPAYNLFIKLDSSFFPNYLLTFGVDVKKIFNENNYFINNENVIPVGSMYLDYINIKYKASNDIKIKFNTLRKRYKLMVAVASQWTVEKKLIKFLKKSAPLNKNILFIFIPRDLKKDYSFAKFPDNIIILKDLNVYQIIKESDFHATVYSTTALEAPALGIPNILINIDGLAEKHFSEILVDRKITKFVNNEKEFLELIINWQPPSKSEIIKLHDGFYKQNHKDNIGRAIKLIHNENNLEFS
jgi:hypothetical protein